VVNQILNEGDTAFLNCQAFGTPLPSVNWYFNGAPVDKNNTIKYMISDILINPITNNSTLTVVNILPSDIGTYICEAANFASSDTSSGVLNVNSKCMCAHRLVIIALFVFGLRPLCQYNF